MGNNYLYHNGVQLKEIRKYLRSNANGAEKILWKFLKGNRLEYKFRRQFSIGKFVADFCCVPLKLAIEIDGWTHDSEKIKVKDEMKTQIFEKNGYKVIRFTNEQIYGDIELILNEIKKVCAEIVSEPAKPLSVSLP